MNQFELYTPGAWIEGGMILPIRRTSHAVDTKKVRRGQWSSVKPVMVLCTIATTVALLLPSIPLGVADVDIVVSDAARTSSLHGDNSDIVPDGYWSRLDAAMASVPRLPDQDISRDPPIMV